MARTGRHTVADLMCAACGAKLGWMYIKAVNADQKYKEGEWSSNCPEIENAGPAIRLSLSAWDLPMDVRSL